MLLDQNFDLVLADVHRPDGSSLNLVWELRRRYSADQLPIIMVSASMDRPLTIQSLQLGAIDCFAMPMHMTVLVAAVARMLDRPHFRPNDLGGVVVNWVEGTSGDLFWVYRPEMNLRLTEEQPEAVRDAMIQRVQSSVETGAALPFVASVKVRDRLVEVPQLRGKVADPGAVVGPVSS